MVLQFSKLPPPIGGVTIHVSRLLFQSKKEQNLNLEVLDYSKERNLVSIFKKIFYAKIIHIHLSNKKLRFIFAFLFRILFKNVVITYHGKYDFKNKFDICSLKLSSASILLNNFSYENARKIQIHKIYKIGAFIPPIEEKLNHLKEEDIRGIDKLKQKFDYVFCTNASSLAYDEKGDEIYMGSELIKYFNNKQNIALVFSSPNDGYYRFLKKQFSSISKNIFFIKETHDFVNVIKQTDGLIRATTMDGDSLSVKEALYYKKPVFATDVVDRPKGVICFSDFEDFDKKYDLVNPKIEKNEDNSQEIFKLYKSILKEF